MKRSLETSPSGADLSGERRARSLVDNVTEAVISTDLAFHVQTWNAAAERMYGWTANEAAGRPMSELVHTEYLDTTRQEVVRQFMENGSWQGEVMQHRRDGTTLNVLSSVVLLRGDDGAPAGAVAVNRDITERAEMIESLRVRDRALEAVASGIVITDQRQPDNPIIYVNPAFEHITGYARAEVLGRNCRFLQFRADGARDDEQEGARLIRDALRGEHDCQAELRNYRKDGRLFWNRLTLSPVRDRSGHLTHFVGIQQDVTRQREAEEALRASEERWRVLVEHHPDALLIYTSSGIRYANPAALALLGAPSAEILAEIGVRSFILPEYRPQFDARQQKIRLLETLPTVEYGIRSLTGATRYVEATSQCVDIDGGPAVQTVLRDVTWRVEARRHLETQNRELEGLLTVGQWLTRALDLDEFFDIVVASVLSMIPEADAMSLWTYDGGTNRLTVRAWQPHDRFEAGLSVAADSNLMKDILASHTATHVANPAAAYRETLAPGAGAGRHAGVRATLGLPLAFKERLLGAILVDNCTREDVFPERAERLLHALGAQIVVALQNNQLYQRLRDVSVRLLEAQETERRRVAHELHDEVGGLLTALQISLKTMPAADADLQHELHRATGLVASLMEKVRHVTLNLRPSMLDDLGLPAALDWLVDWYASQMKVTVHLQMELSHGERFPPAVETAAYRIIQEALTNVVRHAGVEDALVVLRKQDAQLAVHVIDDGRGIDLDRVEEGVTAGLSGMRERAKLLGGHVEIATAPGAGTMISVTLPLSQNPDAD